MEDEQKVAAFKVEDFSTNALSLWVKGERFTIHSDDDLTNEQRDLFNKIGNLLNENSAELLS